MLETNIKPERRIGKFYVFANLVDNNWMGLLKIFSCFVILRAEYLYAGERFEYIAYSPLFDILDLGAEPPIYEIIVNSRNNSVTVEKGY
jgi:hypothetical protein